MNALAPILENDVWMHTRFHQEGESMVLTGYLVAGTRTRIFELKIDMRQIAALITQFHERLHGGSVSGEEIEIGRRRRRRRRRRRFSLKKAGRALKKIRLNPKKITRAIKKFGKSKVIRAIRKSKLIRGASNFIPFARAAKGVLQLAKSKLVATAAKIATSAAKRFGKKLGGLGKVLKLKAGTMRSMNAASKMLTGGTVKRPKAAKFIKKLSSKVKAGLVRRARSRGMMKKYPLKKLQRGITKATRRMVAKKVGRLVKKSAAFRKAVQPRPKKSNRTAIRNVIERSRREPRAFKAREVLKRVALHQARVKQIDKGRAAAGVTGLVVDDRGVVKKGRFVRASSGPGTTDVIYTAKGVQPGHFRHVVSGDCVGADCVGAEPGYLVAGDCVGADCVGADCVGCGPIAGEPEPGYLIAGDVVGGCVGCTPYIVL